MRRIAQLNKHWLKMLNKYLSATGAIAKHAASLVFMLMILVIAGSPGDRCWGIDITLPAV